MKVSVCFNTSENWMHVDLRSEEDRCSVYYTGSSDMLMFAIS